MKRRMSMFTATTATLALLSCVSLARAEGCLQVEVQNLRPGQGMLMLAAYDGAANFGKAAVTSMRLTPRAETMQVQVCGLAGDAVALTLFQDLNDNGKLDSNPFGIPNEPWGASGKVSPMSAPTWETARVSLAGGPIAIALTK